MPRKREPGAPLEGQDIDPEILPLLHALRSSPAIATLGSCCGHRKDRAYVDLAVHKLVGLRSFIAALNAVDQQFEHEVILEVALNWSEQVVTACNFDVFPDWVMLSLTIENLGQRPGPSARLLRQTRRPSRWS